MTINLTRPQLLWLQEALCDITSFTNSPYREKMREDVQRKVFDAIGADDARLDRDAKRKAARAAEK